MMIQKPKHKRRVPKAKNNPVPTEIEQCFFCDRWGYMQTHECIGGNGRRQLSIRYGLQVKLCDTCHREITDNVRLDRVQELKQWGQRKFEQEHSRDDFLKLFGRNYL